MALTACLGPGEHSRCPTGALVPGPRCGPCAAVWRLRHPERRPTAAERAEHAAILAAWVKVNGWWCPGHEWSGHRPHRSGPAS